MSSQSKDQQPEAIEKPATETEQQKQIVKEIGGRKGLEPTRYNDWEKDGRCVDF